MNAIYAPGAGAPVYTCIGCGGGTSAVGASLIEASNGALKAAVCAACTTRAGADANYRTALEMCTAAGLQFRSMERLFASFGVFEVPVTLEGIGEAVGLPPGPFAAAFGARR